MSTTNGIEEIAPNDPLMQAVHGGEVGATGWGDDYHYNGTGSPPTPSRAQETWFDCMMAEMTGRSGRPKTVLEAFATCW